MIAVPVSLDLNGCADRCVKKELKHRLFFHLTVTLTEQVGASRGFVRKSYDNLQMLKAT